jgi:hypothetical protein
MHDLQALLHGITKVATRYGVASPDVIQGLWRGHQDYYGVPAVPGTKQWSLLEQLLRA